MVFSHAVIFGIVHEADEGAAAHIFQLLMAAQMPVVAFFAIKWLPRAPRHTLQILALQAGAALAAVVSVVFLVAQMDRAPVSGTGGPRFESWIARHSSKIRLARFRSGCGAARLARFLGVEEVAGSNPVIPTIF